MIEGRPSTTAFHVAAARAAHLRFDSAPYVLEDVHAERLLDEEGLAQIDTFANDGPWILLENRLFLVLRARHAEERLAAAYARGVRQYVILGAGLDSFAWRQPEGFEDLQVFEVDHPSTQRWKADRLATLGWPVPENTQLVECDFEKQTASEALHATRFDPSQPAVVSWMGVIYYLERETADLALRDLSGLLAPGSELIFDSMFPWEVLPPRYHEIREAMGQFLKGAGEPHINRYDREDIIAATVAAGFSRAALAETKDLADAYAPTTDSERPLSERFTLVVAER